MTVASPGGQFFLKKWKRAENYEKGNDNYFL
jgi:hypothetical protein